MKKTTTTKKKTNKKLLSAFGMFALSGAMLGSATYAWFTMSRDVEVTGLKMTATVPEDLQISVGDITKGKYLNDDDSFLVLDNNSKATEPTEDNMWGNMVDLSHYYEYGRLIPASSINGENIFFTPDATQQGQNIKQSARYYQATNKLAPSGTYNATLHPIANASDPWEAPSGTGYSGAVSWSETYDDGYYVDVPVWIRTSSKENVEISVDAYVKPNSAAGLSKASGAEIELYKATRVAILDDSTGATHNLINMIDGSGTSAAASGWAGARTVVDYYGTSAIHNTPSGAVMAAGNAGGSDNPENPKSGTFGTIYGTAVLYNGTSSVATITGSGGSGYGTPTKVWIRVWLEGEDPECWNQNAGQDWAISLKFSKIGN